MVPTILICLQENKRLGVESGNQSLGKMCKGLVNTEAEERKAESQKIPLLNIVTKEKKSMLDKEQRLVFCLALAAC